MLKLGWFSTGRDREARDLLEVVEREIAAGRISATISFVFINRKPGESHESDLFFDLVRSHNLPLVCLPSPTFATDRVMKRLEFDREVMRHLKGFQVDLCVLAGYMLIVGKEMCQKYKMVNLHPAPPHGPSGTWQEVIWRLIENRAERGGAMMHLVTPELDKGPTVTYCTFPLRGESFDLRWQQIEEEGETSPLFQLIREYELKREFPLIIATLKAFSEGKIRIEEDKVLDSSGREIDGYDLTAEIDEIVKENR